ncbi:MAG: glycosyltransferase family 39 protein [Candidatus Eremiobacteraeota bacterium]|nr:glycosyltransferase family 39 protein [Candidatus Eremiobacteraeota bacterium]
MDVSRLTLAFRNYRPSLWSISLGAILLLAVLLRLKGINNPLLDHPGWRQGDTGAIARNFALLQYNPLYPQTDYDGPPPNYVELELQIVPFLTATLYKVFGVHEVFGRIITLCFSAWTIGVLAYFGRWLYASSGAGLLAALLFSIFPGSLYYGRTFMPDTTMVFFLTAALYACARYLTEDTKLNWRAATRCSALLTLAFLAKPVALVAVLPIAALIFARYRNGQALRWPQLAVLCLIPVSVLTAYDNFEFSIAEWHWASGITRLHVLPSLRESLVNPHAFSLKWHYFVNALGMLSHTMLGAVGFALLILGFVFPFGSRSPGLLRGWLVGAILYAYIVVTVERVDYYLYVFLPLAALSGAGFIMRLTAAFGGRAPSVAMRSGAGALAAIAFCLTLWQNRHEVSKYYLYSRSVYHSAIDLNKRLEPGALVVMGHYDPSVLYYINRKGWQEDPYLWTAFNEQSAIRKGAKYFIAIEQNRFKKNAELYAWMQRFPVMDPKAKWPVYQTQASRILPGAEARWRAFRRAERAGKLKPTAARKK